MDTRAWVMNPYEIIEDVLVDYAGIIAKYVIKRSLNEMGIRQHTTPEVLMAFVDTVVERTILDKELREEARAAILKRLRENSFI